MRDKHADSGLARAGTGRNIYSYSLEPAYAHTFRSGQQSHNS
jgi:hypothetical protein